MCQLDFILKLTLVAVGSYYDVSAWSTSKNFLDVLSICGHVEHHGHWKKVAAILVIEQITNAPIAKNNY